MSVDNSPALSKEKITYRWLQDHVPITWWFWAFGLLAGLVGTVFVAGMTFAQYQPIAEWIKAKLSEPVETAPTDLENEISALKQHLASVLTENNERAESIRVLKRNLLALEPQEKAQQKQKIVLEKQKDELDKKLELALKDVSDLQSKNAVLDQENKKLRIESGSLRKKVDSLIADLSKPAKNSQPKPTEDNRIAKEIIRGLQKMHVNSTANFLAEVIPKITGGVSCDDLSEMLGRVNSLHGDEVVKRVASYVQRPFSDGCFEKLASRMSSAYAPAAIQVLIKSEPKY